MKTVQKMKYGTRITVATADAVKTQVFWGERHAQKAEEFLAVHVRAAHPNNPVITHFYEPLSITE